MIDVILTGGPPFKVIFSKIRKTVENLIYDFISSFVRTIFAFLLVHIKY